MNPSTSPGDGLQRDFIERTVPMELKEVDPVVTVHAEPSHGAAAVALEVADLIESNPRAVLGLATGNTMVDVYAALVQAVRVRDLDTSSITTFNLDEFIGLPPGDHRSFRSFMRGHFHGPLNISDDRALFPDELLAAEDGVQAARRYEEAIVEAGGLDIQLLGLGRNGHIAFNEPGSDPGSRTRVIELHQVTREDAAAEFGGLDATPSSAITMGIATILEARALRILAFGTGKAEAVRHLLKSDENPEVPCTYLRRRHGNIGVHLDSDAAHQLK